MHSRFYAPSRTRQFLDRLLVALRLQRRSVRTYDSEPTYASTWFPYYGEFELRLEAATRVQLTRSETLFIDSLLVKFETWGDEMFLSAKQAQWLTELSERGGYRHDHRISGAMNAPGRQR